jgi:nucleoside 2-deoxyribosyltransferase
MLNNNKMKTKIFLTGPLHNLSSSQIEEFARATHELRSRNFEVTSIFEMLEFQDIEKIDSMRNEILKRRLVELMNCHRLIYLDNYEQDLEATFEVKMAKYLNIPTANIIKFINEDENRNDNEIEHKPTHASNQQA